MLPETATRPDRIDKKEPSALDIAIDSIAFRKRFTYLSVPHPSSKRPGRPKELFRAKRDSPIAARSESGPPQDEDEAFFRSRKTDKSQTEHISSGLPPRADVGADIATWARWARRRHWPSRVSECEVA